MPSELLRATLSIARQFKAELAIALLFVLFLPALEFVGTAIHADEPVDFNRDIRPILAENCFYCHGQDGNKRQADLRLDIRDSAIKANAFVPSNAAESSLISRIHSTDVDEQMPPPKSNRKLSDSAQFKCQSF